jgi:hypothetical protein
MSPMEDVEAHLVTVILKLENMKEPMSASEGLRLANYLIKGAVCEDKVIAWKKKKLSENWNNE